MADAGDVMSSNLDPSSALVDSLDSSLALEVFLALSRYLLKEANSTSTQGCIFFPKIDFFINHYLET